MADVAPSESAAVEQPAPVTTDATAPVAQPDAPTDAPSQQPTTDDAPTPSTAEPTPAVQAAVAPPPAAAPAEAPTTSTATPTVHTATATTSKSHVGVKVIEDADVQAAKAYLMQNNAASNISLYDHLTALISRVLEQRPSNPLDLFESISADVKRSRFDPESYDSPAAVQRVKDTSIAADVAQLQKKLFDMDVDEQQENGAGDIPDIMDLANVFEWAGLSFGREETFLVFLAVKKLVEEKQLKSARLFGKIIGTKQNYYIVEAERGDGDVEEEASEEQEEEQEEEQQNQANNGAPKSKFKPAPPLPKEVASGVNRYVYFVTNTPGAEWTKLPDILPKHVTVARQIRKLFTGDLNTQIVSYPAFPGTEAHYLRAQIARISAATVVSPAGYYKFDEEEASEEGQQAVVLNTEFEWPSADLLSKVENWVHHVPYVLPQGRLTWVNPNPKKEKSEDEEAEEEEEEEEEVEPERGPALLAPLSEDSELPGDVPAWTIHMASMLSPPRYSPVFLRSNRWPGAVSIGYNDKFANMYLGNGLKELCGPYVPPSLPPVQMEYGVEGGPGSPTELIEQTDPTVEQEKEYADANKKEEEAEGEEAEEEEEA